MWQSNPLKHDAGEAGGSEAMNTTVELLREQSGIDCKRTRLTAVVLGNEVSCAKYAGRSYCRWHCRHALLGHRQRNVHLVAVLLVFLR